MSTLLIQGYLLTDPYCLPPEMGWVRIEDHRIVDMGIGEPPGDVDLGGPDTLISPGFVDAHLHWPQIDIVGYDGMPLLEWLEQIVYPAEMRWSDAGHAVTQSNLALRQMIRSGTLGCAAFLTSHVDSVAHAIEAWRRFPVRTVLGRVMMDRQAPDSLCFPVDEWLIDDSISDNDRLSVSINPRFAVGCSDSVLSAAGRFSRESGRLVHTHLAETINECRLALELYPEAPHYTGIYDQFDLLHDRTLLAHATHLSKEEWELIAERRSVVVHCPTANIFLESGAFDLDAARRHGVRLALGSDIAAGPDVAMPRVGRAMIETAKWRRRVCPNDAESVWVPTPAEVWDLMTRGNAEALGWPDAGRLEVGCAADLLLLQPERVGVTILDPHLLSRIVYNWSDDLIETVVLDGEMVDLDSE